MMNEIITVNYDDVTKWDTNLTEVKSMVGQETKMPSSLAQILIED
jgi:hypothetical protein